MTKIFRSYLFSASTSLSNLILYVQSSRIWTWREETWHLRMVPESTTVPMDKFEDIHVLPYWTFRGRFLSIFFWNSQCRALSRASANARVGAFWSRTLNLLRRTWRSNTSLFIQDNGYFYLMEQPEDELSSCECGSSIRIDLDSELNIPLCNTQVMFSSQHHEDHNFPNMRCQNYKIANSCYGLVCSAGIWDEPLVISNPVLGEFYESSEVFH